MDQEDTKYRVDLPNYQGPLDLLLFLIQKDEIDIYNIPIAGITEQYLAYLGLISDLNLTLAGDFFVLAAELMEIKSAMLLPRAEIPDGGEWEDPRLALVEKLLEYKKYRTAARGLADLEARQAMQYPAGGDVPVVESEPEEEFENVFLLFTAFKGVLERFKDAKLYIPGAEGPTLEEQIEYIISELEKTGGAVNFEKFFHTSRVFIVVTFLAMLELLKQRRISVHQEGPLGSIIIKAVEL